MSDMKNKSEYKRNQYNKKGDNTRAAPKAAADSGSELKEGGTNNKKRDGVMDALAKRRTQVQGARKGKVPPLENDFIAHMTNSLHVAGGKGVGVQITKLPKAGNILDVTPSQQPMVEKVMRACVPDVEYKFGAGKNAVVPHLGISPSQKIDLAFKGGLMSLENGKVKGFGKEHDMRGCRACGSGSCVAAVLSNAGVKSPVDAAKSVVVAEQPPRTKEAPLLTHPRVPAPKFAERGVRTDEDGKILGYEVVELLKNGRKLEEEITEGKSVLVYSPNVAGLRSIHTHLKKFGKNIVKIPVHFEDKGAAVPMPKYELRKEVDYSESVLIGAPWISTIVEVLKRANTDRFYVDLGALQHTQHPNRDYCKSDCLLAEISELGIPFIPMVFDFKKTNITNN